MASLTHPVGTKQDIIEFVLERSQIVSTWVGNSRSLHQQLRSQDQRHKVAIEEIQGMYDDVFRLLPVIDDWSDILDELLQSQVVADIRKEGKFIFIFITCVIECFDSGTRDYPTNG